MKKLIVFAICLLIAGIAISQNNQSYVDQTNGGSGNSNYAIVNQSGNQNVSDIDQFGSNQAYVDQVGIQNSSDVDQGTSGTPVSNHYKPAYTGDHEWGVWVYQNGNNNQATTNMQGSSGSADTYQDGDDNIASQEINTSSSGAYANTRRGLDIDQLGDRNEASQMTVASFGCYGIKQMWAIQDGNDNYARQYSRGGMQGRMHITQVGDNNNNDGTNPYDVSCTGLVDPLDLPFLELPSADIVQYQNGRYSDAIIDVLGNGNNTFQWQEYTVWSVSGENDAYINIIGDYNDAAQGQIGEYNYSQFNITGNDNVATNAQLGDNNDGYIDLSGDNNCSGIQQDGDFNLTDIYITGDLNFATSYQSGNSNTGYFTVLGNNNYAVLNQLGNAHLSHINQTGPNNHTVVTQFH